MRCRRCCRRCTGALTTTCRPWRCRSRSGSLRRRARLSRPELPGLLERFRGYLRDNGLPVTRPRDLRAETLLAATDHPSAESLQRALRATGARIGTATVYRTLELMVGAGLARAHDFGEGARRYEAVVAGEQHEHLVCRR